MKYLSATELQTLIDSGYIVGEELTQAEIDSVLASRGYDDAIHNLIHPSEPLRGYKAKPVDVPVKPVVKITNIKIPVAELKGSIYWIRKDLPLIITADCPLPNGELMVMVERVINGSNTVDDVRIKAVISEGVMSMSFIFDTSGNYIFRASRLNEGLDRINEPYHLSFDDVEFDVFIEYP